MKRQSPAVLALLTAFAVVTLDASPAHAEARQVTVAGTGLQDYFDGVLESITVGTDQVADAQRWRTSVSGNSAMTLMIELADDAAGNEIGVYNAGAVTPALFKIFPGTAVAGQYAMASFRAAPTNKLIVTLFETDGSVASSTTYDDVTTDNFGYYIDREADGTGYSQDARNAGELARVLVYKGTGDNFGNWWMCFEDGNEADPDEDRDFDDAILLVESINPSTPVARTTWGALKSRFR